MDANADVTYEIQHFDVQGWLDQYDEASMHPHIFGRFKVIHTFGNLCDYDSMIQSLYKIHQKDNENVEEYMLRVHEAVAVVKHTYPDQVPNEVEGLR